MSHKKEGEGEIWKWFFRSTGWQEYDDEISEKLNNGFSNGEKRVAIDEKRFVDISNIDEMWQGRVDEKIRPLKVKRELGKISTKKRKNPKTKKRKAPETQNPPPVTKSSRKDPTWELQAGTAPSSVDEQHAAERKLFQNYLHQKDEEGKCNTMIHGPNASPNCPNGGWNIWKCVRCGMVNRFPQASCQNKEVTESCNWIQWGWICLDHTR